MSSAITQKVYMIYCTTGCTCCSDEDHFRGLYKSKEDAERRISYFKNPESEFWPVASQYAKRGNYSIREHEAEEIEGNRFIIENIVYPKKFISVLDNGSVVDNDEERL